MRLSAQLATGPISRCIKQNATSKSRRLLRQNIRESLVKLSGDIATRTQTCVSRINYLFAIYISGCVTREHWINIGVDRLYNRPRNKPSNYEAFKSPRIMLVYLSFRVPPCLSIARPRTWATTSLRHATPAFVLHSCFDTDVSTATEDVCKAITVLSKLYRIGKIPVFLDLLFD